MSTEALIAWSSEPPLDQWRAYGLSGGVRLCDTASGLNLPERYKKRDEGGLFVTTFRGGIHHIPEACLAPNVAACELPESQGHAAHRWDPGCVFTARRIKLQPIQNMVRETDSGKTVSAVARAPR